MAATGRGTLGITLAPATGALVADLVAGRRPAGWAEALSPRRYGA